MNSVATGVVPEGWNLGTMGSIGTYQNGFAFNSKTWSTTGRPIVRIQNLTGSGSEFNYFEGDIEDRYVVRPGDLLFSWSATLGVFTWKGPEAVLNQHIFKVASAVDRGFHRYLIEYSIEEMSRHTHGTGMVHITKKRFEALPVPVPPHREQEQIVEILEGQLSRLDATRASIKKIQAKANQFRRSLFHAAFSGELTGHASDEWPVQTLNDLVAVKSDIVDGPFGSNLKSSHYVGEGARVVRLQNIGFGEFVPGDAYIAMEHYETLAKHNVKAGDLLFASLGENLPRACLAPRFDEPAIVKADCIRVRLQPQVNPRYVLHATQRPGAKQWASEALHGMGRPRLGLGTIRSFPVPLPPRRVQDQVVDAVEAQLTDLDAVLAGTKRAESACASLRRSLLHAAFTGKLTEEWRKSHG